MNLQPLIDAPLAVQVHFASVVLAIVLGLRYRRVRTLTRSRRAARVAAQAAMAWRRRGSGLAADGAGHIMR